MQIRPHPSLIFITPHEYSAPPLINIHRPSWIFRATSDVTSHQEIIADIEEKMRRGLDTSKAVKRVLPKHKHHFESLFEYKSDDEDAYDSDSDSLEDVLDQPPAKRKGLFPTY